MTDPSMPEHDPLAEKLTFADDRIKLSDWTPPPGGHNKRKPFGTLDQHPVGPTAWGRTLRSNDRACSKPAGT